MSARPLVIAHRGSSAAAPENTLAALRRAVADGADAVEVDLRLTADGALVLMHDETLERTTGAAGTVAETTLEELAALDAGAWKAPDFAGERIPRFEEALELLAGRCGVFAEIKRGPVGRELAAALRGCSREADLTVLTWSDRPADAADVRAHLPGVPVLELGEVPERFGPAFFAERRRLGYSGLDYKFATLTPEILAAAREAAMPVYAWTVNDAAEMLRAVNMGLAGITTDDPARLLSIV